MKDKSRHLGIDLARVISTYGIVFIHSGDYAPYDILAVQVKELFRFALPFFIAVSFYLLSKPGKSKKISELIFSRCNRLLFPYFCWSLIYIVAKIIKDLITYKFVSLNGLSLDVFAVLFCGSAGVHLYFLPLLFIGNLAGILVVNLKINLKLSIAMYFLSILLYDLVLQFHSGFNMGFVRFYDVFYSLQISNISYVFKFILLQAWFIIVCLPYMFFAKFIYICQDKSLLVLQSKRQYILIAIIFTTVVTIGRSFLPAFLNEPIFGCLFLVLAIKFPFDLSSNFFVEKILLELSQSSFGIYLIHPLIINSFETLILKISPGFMSQVSVFSQIFFSMFGFLTSWLIVRVFINRKILTF
jgi:surface polysaccharide O-acyltransferase-like enzyme